VRVEPGFTDAIARLMEVGHEVEETDGVGVVQAIVVHPDGYEPASDPRKGGEPAGW
jgi:gamma-glutamyltranspeptidase